MHKIGILGAAGIAPRSIIQPVNRREDVTIHAVASRRAQAAQDYAQTHRIAKAYEGYDALLGDPEIDIVYNALPPAGHAEWTIKAFEAGKHVLCEKPIGMTADDARAMAAAAMKADRVLMEAFHDRYHPAFLHLLQIKASGKLGKILSMRAEFYVDIPFDEKSIRHDPAQGGGAMMDLGCYPLHWLRSFHGGEPRILSAQAERTKLGVDQSMQCEMEFDDGVTATLVADIANPPFRGLLKIVGEMGEVELENPCLPHQGHSIRERFGDSFVIRTVAGGTTYDYQLSALLDAIDTGADLPTGPTDAINNMIALDAIYRLAGFPR